MSSTSRCTRSTLLQRPGHSLTRCSCGSYSLGLNGGRCSYRLSLPELVSLGRSLRRASLCTRWLQQQENLFEQWLGEPEPASPSGACSVHPLVREASHSISLCSCGDLLLHLAGNLTYTLKPQQLDQLSADLDSVLHTLALPEELGHLRTVYPENN